MDDLTKLILEKYDRAKVLEIYFARLNGRTIETIPADYADLYEVELNSVKAYLLGQGPQDSSVFRLLN